MKNRLFINLVSNMIYVLSSLALNFVLVPYLSARLGSVAYGFHAISDNFVTYAAVISTALNYMGSRFLAFEYHKNRKGEAEKYFASLFYGDLFLGAALAVAAAAVTVCIDRIIMIPAELVSDVRMTFAFTFSSFILQVVMTAYTAGTYVKDRMDLYAVRNIVYTLLKAGILFCLYSVFSPRIYYISLAAWLGNLFCSCFDYICTKRLLADLQMKKKNFRFACVKRLMASGGWYSVISLGSVLSSGLDLVLANQMTGSYSMGILAVSKTLTGAMNTIRSAIGNVFAPRMIKIYAAGNGDLFVQKVKQYMRITGAVLYVPFAGLTVFSADFYRLWLPDYSDSEIWLVTMLTILSLVSSIAGAAANCLPEIYAIVNQLKIPTVINLFQNGISLLLTFVLLQYTDLGVLLIAGVSSAVFIVYQAVFVIPYAARLLKRHIWIFYPAVIRGILCYAVLAGMFFLIRANVSINGWASFLIVTAACAVSGYAAEIFFMTDKKEKKKLICYFKSRFKFPL